MNNLPIFLTDALAATCAVKIIQQCKLMLLPHTCQLHTTQTDGHTETVKQTFIA